MGVFNLFLWFQLSEEKKQPKLNKAFAKETQTGLYYVDPFKVVDENTEEEIRDSC